MRKELNAEKVRLGLSYTDTNAAAILQTRKILAEKILELRMVDLDRTTKSKRNDILVFLRWYEDTFTDLYQMTKDWHD